MDADERARILGAKRRGPVKVRGGYFRALGTAALSTRQPGVERPMGCFGFNCSLSGLPIDEGDRVIFLALAQGLDFRDQIAWTPATLPIRARYNNYGSIENLEVSPVTEAFFRSLSERVVERPVGENPYHDVAVTRTMDRQQWLKALWENRVQIQLLDFELRVLAGSADVFQTMVREEVWQYLARANAGRLGSLRVYEVRSALADTGLAPSDLKDDALHEARFELLCVTHSMARLGLRWQRGGHFGPQVGDWAFHHGFQQMLLETVTTERDKREFEEFDED